MTDKIVKFSASWCGPCQALASQLEGVDLGVPVVNVDIDQETESAVKHGIRSVPTLVFYKGDTEVSRIVGSRNIKELKDWIASI